MSAIESVTHAKPAQSTVRVAAEQEVTTIVLCAGNHGTPGGLPGCVPCARATRPNARSL